MNSLLEKLKEKFSQKYLEVIAFDDFNKVDTLHFGYLIINLLDIKRDMFVLSNVLKNIECKVLLIRPLYVKKSEKYVSDLDIKNLMSLSPNLGTLLVPDILSKDVVYDKNSLAHDLIMQSILSERVKTKFDDVLVNTVTINKLAEVVVKNTFSFGISGQIISLIGPRKSKKTFITKYIGVKPENIIQTRDETDISELYCTGSINLEFSLQLAVKNTINNFSNTTNLKIEKIEESLIPSSSQVKEKVKEKKPRIKLKYLYNLLIRTFIVFVTPFALILISVLLLFISSRTAFENNKLAINLLNASKQTASIVRNLSFGNNFIYDTSNLIYEVSTLGSEAVVLVNSGRSFVSNIMSDQEYDLTANSNNISASLDKIHTDISFLQSDINELKGFIGNLIKNKLAEKSINIGDYKNKIYVTKKLFSRISVLLGQEKPQKYLVLLQNNMELRPTGGFIGSFALITFDRGRLSEIVVNDVYTADGQLKGHVDPPEPIRKYLGEGGWYLRDSNWDPNFSVSAEKAEWFLEKEMGEKVDGVIGVDLYFVKRLLDVTGPINLPEFNKQITKDNLYDEIQSEVEDSFFPGSIKKASILTSLTRNLITEIENLEGQKYLNLFKEIYESMERKHVQFYFHDDNAQEAILDLNYAGQFTFDNECGLRCLSDGYALIDANLGVNKSNYFIKRSHQLNILTSKNEIMHELLVSYDNSASPSIGSLGVYENYARVLLPKTTVVEGVRAYEADGTYKDLEYNLVDTNTSREVGFVVEVLPGSSKKLQIAWKIPAEVLSGGGQYNLNILKQAGTDEDPLTINIKEASLVLTGRRIPSYNTNLARDFSAVIFFKPLE